MSQVFGPFAFAAKANTHHRVLAGVNDHHKAEGTFNALVLALDAT